MPPEPRPEVPWRFRLRFWGVRGSIPTPCPQNLGYGGNTSCLQVETPQEEALIFDAGSGIRGLGLHLARQSAGRPLQIHLFLTHFHWDHVLGLPFFVPLFDKRNSITIYSSPYSAKLQSSIAAVMQSPHFPVPFEDVATQIQLVELGTEPVCAAGTEIRAFPVNHPQGACGYRIEAGGASAVYLPDREPGFETLDRSVREDLKDADVLMHDAQYTPQEYSKWRGWGHSTWEEAVAVARDARVKRLVLFHHDPEHSDDAMRRIAEEAGSVFPAAEAAREDSVIEL
jgi:phosphoribosyl 1,2-cyclic phosphodiesterase